MNIGDVLWLAAIIAIGAAAVWIIWKGSQDQLDRYDRIARQAQEKRATAGGQNLTHGSGQNLTAAEDDGKDREEWIDWPY